MLSLYSPCSWTKTTWLNPHLDLAVARNQKKISMPFVTSSTKKKGKMEPATEVEVGLFLFLFMVQQWIWPTRTPLSPPPHVLDIFSLNKLRHCFPGFVWWRPRHVSCDADRHSPRPVSIHSCSLVFDNKIIGIPHSLSRYRPYRFAATGSNTRSKSNRPNLQC